MANLVGMNQELWATYCDLNKDTVVFAPVVLIEDAEELGKWIYVLVNNEFKQHNSKAAQAAYGPFDGFIVGRFLDNAIKEAEETYAVYVVGRDGVSLQLGE